MEKLDTAWIDKHKNVFSKKASLQFYYLNVFAKMLRREFVAGRILEIGSGPGFLSNIAEDITTSDIYEHPSIQVTCDAHALPFEDEAFNNVFFVDVLHHLRAPGTVFKEISRVLPPGGRLIMIEPYTTPLSRIFYKYLHHEGCYGIKDVWEKAFPADKDPMSGNAEIPRTCLESYDNSWGLKLKKIELFAGPSYLLTGGFQSWQLPLALIKALLKLEKLTAPLWSKLAATRCLAVFEKRK
ncbi:MAG: class I SAM-dependent methyltransferase [Candidatus Margulisiibacteriota bacterium]